MLTREQLIDEYKVSIRATTDLLNAAPTEQESEIVRGMLSDLRYARRYLKLGFDPSDRSAGIHKVEQQGGYEKRRVLSGLDLILYGANDHMEIFGDVLQCDRVLSDNKKRLIRYVLGELSEQQLTCYMLHYGHCRTLEQIGEELGIAEGTVQTHLDRAREKVMRAAQEVQHELE